MRLEIRERGNPEAKAEREAQNELNHALQGAPLAAGLPILLDCEGFEAFTAVFPPSNEVAAAEYNAIRRAFRTHGKAVRKALASLDGGSAKKTVEEETQSAEAKKIAMLEKRLEMMENIMRKAGLIEADAEKDQEDDDDGEGAEASKTAGVEASTKVASGGGHPKQKGKTKRRLEEDASTLAITTAQFRALATICFELQRDAELWTSVDVNAFETALERAVQGLVAAYPEPPRNGGHLRRSLERVLNEKDPAVEAIAESFAKQARNQIAHGAPSWEASKQPIRWFGTLVQPIDITAAGKTSLIKEAAQELEARFDEKQLLPKEAVRLFGAGQVLDNDPVAPPDVPTAAPFVSGAAPAFGAAPALDAAVAAAEVEVAAAEADLAAAEADSDTPITDADSDSDFAVLTDVGMPVAALPASFQDRSKRPERVKRAPNALLCSDTDADAAAAGSDSDTPPRCQACGSTTLSEFCDECVNRSIQGEHAALEEEGMRVLMMLEQFE